MKETTTITITTEKQDYVWCVEIKHNESMVAREFSEVKLFAEYSDAYTYMRKEVMRLGSNLVEMYGGSLHTIYERHTYEASYSIFGHTNKKIDEISAILSQKEIQ